MWKRHDISVFVNVLLGGEREELSARIGRNAVRKGGVWCIAERVVDTILREPNHCWSAYLRETKRRAPK